MRQDTEPLVGVWLRFSSDRPKGLELWLDMWGASWTVEPHVVIDVFIESNTDALYEIAYTESGVVLYVQYCVVYIEGEKVWDLHEMNVPPPFPPPRYWPPDVPHNAKPTTG